MSRSFVLSLGDPRHLRVAGLAVGLALGILCARTAHAAPITLSSTVSQSGANTTIGGGAGFTSGAGWDFAGQDFASLASIESITITLTLFDLDTAPGNLDFNKVTLGLDGVNTGIRLNGFPDAVQSTQTIADQPRDPATQQPSTSVADAIVSAIKSDGRLTGSLLSTDNPSFNGFQAPATFSTTLTITGQTGTGSGGGGGGGGGGGTGDHEWDLSLSNPNQSGPPGSFLIFDSSITNSGPGDLTLDLATLDFLANTDPSFYTFEFAPAFLDTLGIIPTSGYSGPLFIIQWLPAAPVGTIGNGLVELTAALPGDPATRSVEFRASVAPSASVPEPGTLMLLAMGVGALARGGRRTRRGEALAPRANR